MASAEKGLEDQLSEVGNSLLTPPSAVEELLPLLDQAETFLSRVEQSPSKSMSVALQPAMKALVAKELLGHSDTDVKVAVASCISEITRITAPEAPFDDELMKEIFQMIVGAFEKLDDVSSRSYSKRVSILETVAKVRSCVVMLDLECDTLILEMFQHFLKTTRDNHPDNVFSSMEMIMTLVLEESEDVSSELLSTLLHCVKTDNKDVLPIARRLGEKVLGSCTEKLKDCLLDVVHSIGYPLSDYSKIVASICQTSSDVVEQNDLDAFGECLADDSKLSERTVSDELPQGSGKVESEVGCAAEVGTHDGKSPKSVMNNGTVQPGNDDSLAEPTSPNKKTERSRHRNLPKSKAEADNLDLMNVKTDSASDNSTKKKKGGKINSAIQSTETIDHSRIDSDKEAVELPNKRKGRSREAESSHSEDPSGKVAESTVPEDHGKKKLLQKPAELVCNETISDAPSTPIEKRLPDATRPKRGRPSRSKKTEDEAVHSADISLKKQTEGISDPETKSLRPSGKKAPDDGQAPAEDFHSKKEVDVTSDSEGKPLKRHLRKSASLKGTVSSPKTVVKADKDQNNVEESLKTKSRKKRARPEEEVSKKPHGVRKHGDNLVGSKIKVWWPDDKRFYHGVIESFNTVTKKHKVLYVDGDEEILFLDHEDWDFVEGDVTEEELSPDDASEIRQRKKAKSKSDSASKQAKANTPSKSGGTSSGKVRTEGTKSGGKPGRRGGIFKAGSSKSSESSPSESKSREKTGVKSSVESPRSGSKSKEELINKSKDQSPKAITTKSKDDKSKFGKTSKDDTTGTGGSKSKDEVPKSGSKSKDVMPKTGGKAKDHVARTGGRSKNDDVQPMEDDTPKVGRGKLKGVDNTAKSGSKSDANGTSVKGKPGPSKAQESEEGGEERSGGKKRRRKVHT